MSKRVGKHEIEQIVGVPRHATKHIARAVSAEQTVYILHSHACCAAFADLRECPWSLAMDEGIDPSKWTEDAPVEVRVRAGLLVPGAVQDVS